MRRRQPAHVYILFELYTFLYLNCLTLCNCALSKTCVITYYNIFSSCALCQSDPMYQKQSQQQQSEQQQHQQQQQEHQLQQQSQQQQQQSRSGNKNRKKKKSKTCSAQQNSNNAVNTSQQTSVSNNGAPHQTGASNHQQVENHQQVVSIDCGQKVAVEGVEFAAETQQHRESELLREKTSDEHGDGMQTSSAGLNG